MGAYGGVGGRIRKQCWMGCTYMHWRSFGREMGQIIHALQGTSASLEDSREMYMSIADLLEGEYGLGIHEHIDGVCITRISLHILCPASSIPHGGLNSHRF